MISQIGTIHFQKIELEDIAYYLNTGKKRKRARYLRNENLLIGSEEKTLTGSSKRRFNKEESGTELFGNGVV